MSCPRGPPAPEDDRSQRWQRRGEIPAPGGRGGRCLRSGGKKAVPGELGTESPRVTSPLPAHEADTRGCTAALFLRTEKWGQRKSTHRQAEEQPVVCAHWNATQPPVVCLPLSRYGPEGPQRTGKAATQKRLNVYDGFDRECPKQRGCRGRGAGGDMGVTAGGICVTEMLWSQIEGGR